MNILIIEPDKVLSNIYINAFKNLGLDIYIAKSAQAALTLADGYPPSLVILEIQLVEHSGIEFLYEFRSYSEWKEIPIIIYSCIPVQEFNNNWQILKQEIGIEDYLYKPKTNLKQLIKLIKEVTSKQSETIKY
jgi:DNA-binding response OmpR family regulator